MSGTAKVPVVEQLESWGEYRERHRGLTTEQLLDVLVEQAKEIETSSDFGTCSSEPAQPMLIPFVPSPVAAYLAAHRAANETDRAYEAVPRGRLGLTKRQRDWLRAQTEERAAESRHDDDCNRYEDDR